MKSEAGMVRTGLLALALVAGAATPPSALADDRPKSRIVIKELRHGGAAGKVSSHTASCVAKRKVSLFIYEDFFTDKVAITYTNSKGEWKVTKNLKDGRYFAKVERSKGCRYDNSKARRLG